MADSVATQADMKKLAEAYAIIKNIQLKRAEREAHEELLAEAKRAEREANKELLAEANRLKKRAKRTDTPSAKPFLTKLKWMSLIIIAFSLPGFLGN